MKDEVTDMAIENVKEYFRQYGIQDRILEFDVSSATVELAAEAVGCEPKRIAKTMSFLVKEQPVLIVLAGDARISNSKFKGVFHTKAKMIPKESVEKLIGHEIGGVCPFAVKTGVEVYLDSSLKRFETVFPAAGSSNSAIELSIEELMRYSGAKDFVDVSEDLE